LERAGVADRTLVLFTSDNGFAPYVGARELEARGHHPSGPLRGYKADAWEGGHRVPFIVRYPGVARPGTTCDALVHQADLMATIADVLGASLPEDAGEDSVSLLPLLRGSTAAVRRHAVSCACRGVPTIRDGQWKLILGAGGPGVKEGASEVWLSDLSADLGERENLAAREPDRVAAMRAAYAELVAAGRSTPGPRQRNDVPVKTR
jgi:arylsulfatase A-like enzyme